MAINDNNEVWFNELVQELSRYPGTPYYKEKVPLPICRECPEEVKPGEDLCWGCLGEIPKDTYDEIYNSIVAMTYPSKTDYTELP